MFFCIHHAFELAWEDMDPTEIDWCILLPSLTSTRHWILFSYFIQTNLRKNKTNLGQVKFICSSVLLEWIIWCSLKPHLVAYTCLRPVPMVLACPLAIFLLALAYSHRQKLLNSCWDVCKILVYQLLQELTGEKILYMVDKRLKILYMVEKIKKVQFQDCICFAYFI